MGTVRVIGLGNVLMSDDAFGPHVINHLTGTCAFDDDVELLELGTPGFDLLPYVAGCDALIVVDTVRTDGPPGALRLYRRDDLTRLPTVRTHTHEPTLLSALAQSELTGEAPADVLLVGVVPANTGSGIGLDDSVRDAIPTACEAVRDELARLGRTIRPIDGSAASPAWWEII